MKRCSIHEQFNKVNLIFKLTQLKFFYQPKGFAKKIEKVMEEKGMNKTFWHLVKFSILYYLFCHSLIWIIHNIFEPNLLNINLYEYQMDCSSTILPQNFLLHVSLTGGVF